MRSDHPSPLPHPCPLPPARPQFTEQFLTSAVRTEDPSEANLFYIPEFIYSYTGRGGGGGGGGGRLPELRAAPRLLLRLLVPPLGLPLLAPSLPPLLLAMHVDATCDAFTRRSVQDTQRAGLPGLPSARSRLPPAYTFPPHPPHRRF